LYGMVIYSMSWMYDKGQLPIIDEESDLEYVVSWDYIQERCKIPAPQAASEK